ncbi:PHP domain-containing protein [Halorubrum sp. Boch-26]|uniref:PHP domain-containing protein n=1 Tax=Halorubrum sp. Boch-26 TaxID=2994426 RepID=UPI00246957B7|nr:PHP domain-containing protein [Halorubrum sp. Boch-26]
MTVDVHAHTSYSDGSGIPLMVDAAEAAGIDAVGFADHCSLSQAWRDERLLWNRNFDRTYARRREALSAVADRTDLTLYDAVEMDYEPELEGRIRDFLDEAGFDYAVGSVHYVAGKQVFPFESFADASEAERRAFVDDYYDAVVSLVESELFDVLAHADLVENHPALHGLTTAAHRERVAAACADSPTVPEINAGRAGDRGEFDLFHPTRPFFEAFRDRGVRFVVGTDSHDPEDFADRVPRLERYLDETGVEPIGTEELLSGSGDGSPVATERGPSGPSEAS